MTAPTYGVLPRCFVASTIAPVSPSTAPAAPAGHGAVAGSSAYAKGVPLGVVDPGPELLRERGDRLVDGQEMVVDLLCRAVPVVRTPDGLRAVSKGKPGSPAQVEKYLAGKFGDRLDEARQAMQELAAVYDPAELQRRGFRLYERFRPSVPAGESGWGAKGELDLAKVRAAAS